MQSKRNLLLGALVAVVIAASVLFVLHKHGIAHKVSLVDCGHLVDRRGDVIQDGTPSGDAERCFAEHAAAQCDARLVLQRYGTDTGDLHQLQQQRRGNRCEVIDDEQSSVLGRHYAHTTRCKSVRLDQHGLRVGECEDSLYILMASA